MFQVLEIIHERLDNPRVEGLMVDFEKGKLFLYIYILSCNLERGRTLIYSLHCITSYMYDAKGQVIYAFYFLFIEEEKNRNAVIIKIL